MNVLLVVPWDQEFGGVASVVGNLARQLAASGHHVVFLHPGGGNRLRQRTTASGFRGYALDLRAPFSAARPIRSMAAFAVYVLPTLYELMRMIRSEKIEVVNIHYPVEAFAVFGVLRRLLPIRLVVSVHGADLFPDGRPMRRYPRSTRFLLAAADAVVTPSESFLGDVLAAFPRAAGKTVSIHNGVDLRELARERAAAPRATRRGRYVLCIATFSHKKALDVLVTAFASVSRAHPSLDLVLVGDGPLRREHEELVRSLSLRERVEFLGWQGRPEVVRLLHDCEIFVLPSRSEPFGIVVTEALACRKAVVASAVGGIPEIIEHGKSGLLVEPDRPEALAEALLTLLEDDARRESLAATGHQRAVEHFTCEATGSRYEALYSDLLRQSRRRR